jgi:site-specific recombinase XerD
MLERYFVRPKTTDQIRASWIGPAIEQYVGWLSDQGYAARNVFRRVPILMRFGQFAQARGATQLGELPGHVEPFVEDWVRERGRRCSTKALRLKVACDARVPVEQMLRLAVPGFAGKGRSQRGSVPFVKEAPGFFDYLRTERGLRPSTLLGYGHYLSRFEAYLRQIALEDLRDLSPAILSAFVVERRARGLARTSIREACGVLRVFLRYLHRERVVPTDLSASVEWPQVYRLSTVPRSITWSQVRQVLESVDRRTPTGKRDYAMLLLLTTYGLRGREVAALTLDDIDWRRERLRIPDRKAGHSTAFPLSSVVGEALADYLRHGRPETGDRHVFFRALAPVRPIASAAVSSRAAHYLRVAGIEVPRPGSHTFRHTCVQRLVDAGLPFKVIGDFVGHRSPASTDIYAKVAIEALRQVALGDGEDVL